MTVQPTLPPTPHPAGAGARVAAYLIDLAVVAGAAVLAWPVSHSWLVEAIIAAEAGVVLVIARAATGRTPGSLASRTVAHASHTAHAPGLRREAVRSSLVALLHVTAVGPLLTTAFPRVGQDWIDRIAGTAISDSRARTTVRVRARDAYGRETVPAPSPWAGFAPAESRDQTASAPLPALPAITNTPPLGPGVIQQSIWIVMDSGMREEITGVVVLGRAPTPAPGSRERVVPVPDQTRSLSRTHVRIGRDDHGVWIEDAFSANGTSVVSPDGSTGELVRGQRTRLSVGTRVVMGDRSLSIESQQP